MTGITWISLVISSVLTFAPNGLADWYPDYSQGNQIDSTLDDWFEGAEMDSAEPIEAQDTKWK